MAVATISQVPNLFRVQVDDTAGTATYQTYDTGSSSWVTQWTLSLSSGNITVAENQTVSGDLTVSKDATVDGTATVSGDATLGGTLSVAKTIASQGAFSDNESLHSESGQTAGTIYWSMPHQGTSFKTVAIYLDAYENDTSTADTVTFPTAFTYTPYMNNDVNVSGTTLSKTELQIDPDNTTTYTGWILISGF